MFVGHYGAAFAAKGVDRRIPLWVLFLVVRLPDLTWIPLLLLGVEKARVDPAVNATLPIDLYYMPYSHSLPAVLMVTVFVSALAATLVKGQRRNAAMAMAISVGSHWVLDFLVHSPDLPLYGNEHKVGLGLWNHVSLAFTLEIAVLSAGMWVCTARLPHRPRLIWVLVYGVFLVIVHWVGMFVVKPPTLAKAAEMFMALYFVLALSAWAWEKLVIPSAHPAVQSAAASV